MEATVDQENGEKRMVDKEADEGNIGTEQEKAGTRRTRAQTLLQVMGAR